MVVLLRLAACSTPASQFSMVASLRSQSSLEMLPASLGSSAAIAPSIRNGRPAAPSGLQYSLAHWAYYGLFRSTIHNGRFATPNGLQRSLVHWTFASPISRTARGEAPSHWRRPLSSCRFVFLLKQLFARDVLQPRPLAVMPEDERHLHELICTQKRVHGDHWHFRPNLLSPPERKMPQTSVVLSAGPKIYTQLI